MRTIKILAVFIAIMVIFQAGVFTGWTCVVPLNNWYDRLPVWEQRCVVFLKNILIPLSRTRWVVLRDAGGARFNSTNLVYDPDQGFDVNYSLNPMCLVPYECEDCFIDNEMRWITGSSVLIWKKPRSRIIPPEDDYLREVLIRRKKQAEASMK